MRAGAGSNETRGLPGVIMIPDPGGSLLDERGESDPLLV